jgi:hypothetical protein
MWRRGLMGALALTWVCAAQARASCLVTNETKYEFVVSSGNSSNQKVKANATTTIEAGKVSGKSDEGRTISGACKDGARLVVREKNGVPLLLPWTPAKPTKGAAKAKELKK